MNPLIKRFTVLACICLALGGAKPVEKASESEAKQTMYYWFWSDTDFYHQYATVANEEYDATGLLGYGVDENASGGTVVLKGYLNGSQPHNFPAVKTLYMHH